MWLKIKKYFQEVISELRKTTWPTKKSTKNMTILVIVSVAILAFFLGAIDVLLQKIVATLL